jgi:hypothetical protein
VGAAHCVIAHPKTIIGPGAITLFCPLHFVVPRCSSTNRVFRNSHTVTSDLGLPLHFLRFYFEPLAFPHDWSYKICRLIRLRVLRPRLTSFPRTTCFHFFCFSSRPCWCCPRALCVHIAAPSMDLCPTRCLRLPLPLPSLMPTVSLPLASAHPPMFPEVPIIGGVALPQNMPFLDLAMKSLLVRLNFNESYS